MTLEPPAAMGLPPQPLAGLSRDQLVAASSGWLASSLNLGGQGLGYLYQRRWGAFWLGGLAALGAAVALGAAAGVASQRLQEGLGDAGRLDRTEATLGATILGACTGVMAVSVASALESALAVKGARRRLQQAPAEPVSPGS